MRSEKTKKTLVLALFFVSGLTGLVYEVAWTRMFVTVFGSTTHAVSTVLAAYMGGLALGALVVGKRGDRVSRPILLYGLLEIVIGGYALVFPRIIRDLGEVYSQIFDTFGQQTLPVSVVRFLLSFVVILVPTTLMGATLPILSKFAGRDLHKVGKSIGTLYAVNTFGAVIGSFATGFILLELVGVRRSILIAVGLSLLVGLVAILLGRKAETGPALAQEDLPGGEEGPSRYTAAIALLAIAVSGAGALACEVVYTKILVFSLGATAHAFSLMLTTFLVGLAIGSLVMSRVVDRRPSPESLLGVIEILIGLSVLLSIVLLAKLDTTHHLLSLKDAGGNLFRLRGAGFVQAAVIMLLPALLCGSAFPVVTRIYARRNHVSSSVGRIYFFNTIGAVSGSLAAGFLLVPLLGSARSLALVAAFNVAAGVLLFSCGKKRKAWIAAAVVCLAVMGSGALLIDPAVFARTFSIKEIGSELVFFKEGVSGTVTVHRYADYDLIAVDGVNVAGTNPLLRITQKLQGHLPVLLAQNGNQVAHIGFGTGETLRTLTLHHVEKIDGIEINRDVIDTSKRFFEELNQNVFDRPDVNIIIMDGKNYVLLTRKRYDVIMTDSVYPGAGGSALYTYDHFLEVRKKLKPGGIASCWLPLDLSKDDIKIALRAFHDAFPNMSVWYFYMTYSKHALLVGKNALDFKVDVARFQAAFDDPEIRKDLESIYIDDPWALISCMIADGDAVEAFYADAPRHTDDHPVLEFGFARRGTGYGRPYLASVLEEMLARRPALMPYLTNVAATGLDPNAARMELNKRMSLSSLLTGGHISNALGEIGLARAQYGSALEAFPGNRMARHSVEVLDQAIAAIREEVDSGKAAPSTIHRLAVIYLSEGRYQEALGLLEQLRKAQPDHPEAYEAMGEGYLRWGKPRRALEYLEKARDMRPNDDKTLVRLAGCYEALGSPDQARDAFQTAISINPGNYRANALMGKLLLDQGDATAARARLEAAVRIDSTRPLALYYLGLAWESEREWQSAADYFRKTLTYAPTYYAAHFHLGNALFEQGNTQAAIKSWQATLALNPGHEGATSRLGAVAP